MTTEKGGRPLKFEIVEDLQNEIDKYFKFCEDSIAGYNDDGLAIYKEPPTITGLALALDTSRKVLIDYENRDEFSYTIKRAKTRVEHFYEKKLHGKNVAGSVFALKNFDWADKPEDNNKDKEVHIHISKLVDEDKLT
jgi:hypothetical protein